MRGVLFMLLLLLAAGCVKHDEAIVFKPISSFSGRLLVMSQAHRFQMEVDWQGDRQQGGMRLTHAATGRIVDVSWLDGTMLWRDNREEPVWRALSQAQLLDMGMLLPPWALARILSGDYPEAMQTKGQRTWQGLWSEDVRLKIRWSQTWDRLEITDMRYGKRLVVVFAAVNHES
ncbi:MAG: hypothetical protein Q9M19_00925 [Mariprofundaceae bacterium]|nr:hypothetical protein [Mariprofundaceae bacterium]